MKKVIAFCSLLFVMLVSAPQALAQEVFDRGHVDAFYITNDGGVGLALKEDVTGSGVIHAGNDVVLKVNQSAYSTVTEGVDGIGRATYFLPQTQSPDLVWPGWDTQQVEGAVDFHFDEVSGPGAVYVFETAGFGDINPIASTGLELRSGSVVNQPYPAHRHVNWAFTEAGTYTMTVRASTQAGDTNAVTYTWQVGDGQAPAQPAQQAEADAERKDAGSPQRSTPNAEQVTGNGSSATQSEQAHSTPPQQLAETGPSLVIAAIAILGLGLLTLGLGFARL